MFEQMENSSNLEASTSLSIITNNIVKPKVSYIKTEDLLKLFNISKLEYNNILVRINNILYFLY